MGCGRPRMDDELPSAKGQLPRNAGGHVGSVRLSGNAESDGRNAECLKAEGRRQKEEGRGRRQWDDDNDFLSLCPPPSAVCFHEGPAMSDAIDHDDDHVHHPSLQHQFEDLGQQHEASTLGMWMFLSTEILFFGGVLCAYWIYRTIYPEAWAIGAAQQKALWGGINTIVL